MSKIDEKAFQTVASSHSDISKALWRNAIEAYEAAKEPAQPDDSVTCTPLSEDLKPYTFIGRVTEQPDYSAVGNFDEAIKLLGPCYDEFNRWFMDEGNLRWFVAKCNEAPKRESGWQPIETAPKDGTKIIGYDDGYAVTMYYVNNHPNVGWFEPMHMHSYCPTRWMPLPEAPKTEGGE
jgi:hypothetical protein